MKGTEGKAMKIKDRQAGPKEPRDRQKGETSGSAGGSEKSLRLTAGREGRCEGVRMRVYVWVCMLDDAGV